MRLSRKQAEFTKLMVRLKAWAYLQPQLKSGDVYLKTTWVVRSKEYQRILVAKRRSRTLRSMHMKGLAEDIQLYAGDGTPLYAKKYYLFLGEYAEKIGLIWGGRWKSPLDPYHFQYKEK